MTAQKKKGLEFINNTKNNFFMLVNLAMQWNYLEYYNICISSEFLGYWFIKGRTRWLLFR